MIIELLAISMEIQSSGILSGVMRIITTIFSRLLTTGCHFQGESQKWLARCVIGYLSYVEQEHMKKKVVVVAIENGRILIFLISYALHIIKREWMQSHIKKMISESS